MSSDRFQKAFEKQLHTRKGLGVTERVTPKITTGAMTGQLVINAAGLKLMQLMPGDKIYLFDMGDSVPTIESRYYVTRGFQVANKWHGCKIHDNGKFNHSTFYNSLISNGVISFVDNLRMLTEGFFIRHGKEKFKANRRVTMFLERYIETSPGGIVTEEFSPAPGVAPQPFYRLYGRMETKMDTTA